jgi:hypothetical protein
VRVSKKNDFEISELISGGPALSGKQLEALNNEWLKKWSAC